MTGNDKIRIFISAPGQEALAALYGAALQDPRFSVVGLSPTAELLQAQLPTATAEVAVVDAELLIDAGEKGLKEFLTKKHGGAALVVLTPPGMENMRAALLNMDRVREVLTKPVNPGELLNRLYQVGQSERAMLAQVAPAQGMKRHLPLGDNRMAGPVGTQVFAVTASKGGPGKTTVAVNLAYRLAQHGVRAILIGFDTPDATGIQLGLPRSPNMSAYFRNPSRQTLQNAIQQKDGALDVLLSPNDPVIAARIAAGDLITRAGDIATSRTDKQLPPRRLVEDALSQALTQAQAGDIARLVDEVRLLAPPYAAIVMDLPPTQTEWNIQPLMRATSVIVVAEPSLSDQVNAIDNLNILTGVLDPRYRIPKEAIYFVLNRVTDRDPLTPNAFREGVESKLGWAPPVIARIGHDPEVRRSQLNFTPPVVRVDAFREGVDQMVAFFFPSLSGVKPAKSVKIGGFRLRWRK